MARKQKKVGGGSAQGWLITFSDLVTLLLTFFVLLLSMSSMDVPMLTRISATTSDSAYIEHAGRGRIPENIRLVLDIVTDPASILEKQDRIKDLLFHNETLPPELSPGKLDRNLTILAHPEGVVFVLNESILFPEGAYALTDAGHSVLSALLPLLHYTSADLNIGGHTDDKELSLEMNNYELSGRRALSVLEYFLQQSISVYRFSISGYGPDRPLAPNDSDRNREKNRRVELLLKTTQWLGRYL